jgi:hypothetical protein
MRDKGLITLAFPRRDAVITGGGLLIRNDSNTDR